MTPETEDDPCPCSGGEADVREGVELLVLIDSSGSMGPREGSAAAIITDVAPKAEAIAKDRCDAKAKVTYLFVDGNDSGDEPTRVFTSLFDQSHESFLISGGAAPPFAADGDGPWDREQGGKAITDLCEKHTWEEGFCRAIFISAMNG